jgi:alpha-L-rhamnosidase
MKYLKLILLISFTTLAQAQLKFPKDLTTEYLADVPLVDVLKPRIGWTNKAFNYERGQNQTAYEVRVSDSFDKLSNGNLWQSGKIISEEHQRVEYQGKTLKSRQECWWQVRVWDKDDKVSGWSKPAHWRMGLLNAKDWQAKWIGAPWQSEEAIPKPSGGPQNKTEILPPPAPLLRKAFTIHKEIKSAVVFTTGLGYFEFYANGEKIGYDVLIPNQTNYGKRPDLEKAYIAVPDKFSDYKVMYLAYDITANLKQGKNAIGGILGNGFYNDPKFWTASYGSPRFLAQLHISYRDGTEEVIVSDETWKAEKSPILMDLVYDGEIYDAGKEIKNWSETNYNDSNWQNVVLRKAPFGRLVAHTAETDKVTKQYAPTKIEKLGDGHYKVDFPEEISGWLRLKDVKGPAGQKVHITFNGNLYSGENTYIFKGEGFENYAPRFNWFVFSGVEITGWPGELKPEHLIAEAVNTDLKEKAVFDSSNELLNEIHKIWKRSQLDNTHGGIASDCPHRERSGYTGDAQVTCNTVMQNYDARAFYQKWVTDMRDAQIPETGYVPNGAPWQPGCGGGVAWGAAIHVIPWEFYQQYGAKDMLSDNYEAMKGYVKYMQTWLTTEGIMHSQRTGQDGKPLKWWNLGDWAGICEDCLPPDELVHSFYYWLGNDITSKTAAVLGKNKDAKMYAELAESAKNAFQKKFYQANPGTYGKYGANIFALKMGVPESQKLNVIKSLKKDIAEAKGHFDTGIFGTRYFFEILSENGMSELAYNAITKTSEPSFGNWVALGSTTTREHWSETGSYNHPMFGGGLSWLYTHLAGMQMDENEPGYKHIIFKPEFWKEESFINFERETPQGMAKINFTSDIAEEIVGSYENGKVTKGKFGWLNYIIEVPVGSHATIYPPIANPILVMESDIYPRNNHPDVEYVGNENGPIYRVKSGSYEFKYKYFFPLNP